MDYKRFENTIIARMDKGEEILEQLEVISRKENIRLASQFVARYSLGAVGIAVQFTFVDGLNVMGKVLYAMPLSLFRKGLHRGKISFP